MKQDCVNYSSFTLVPKETFLFLTGVDYNISGKYTVIFSVNHDQYWPRFGFVVMEKGQRKSVYEGIAVPDFIFRATEEIYCVIAKTTQAEHQVYKLLTYARS